MTRPPLSLILAGTFLLSACAGSMPGVGSATLVVPSIGETSANSPEAASLVVRIHHLAGNSRALLAVGPDIDRLWIQLRDAKKQVVSQWVPRAAFTNGTASASFGNLSPGTFDVTVSALRADGAVIGRASAYATVKSGLSTPVDLALQLEAADLTGSPAPKTGNLTATATLVDGPLLAEAPEATSISLSDKPPFRQIEVINWFTHFMIDKRGDIHVEMSGSSNGLRVWHFEELLNASHVWGDDRSQSSQQESGENLGAILCMDADGYYYSASGSTVYRTAFNRVPLNKWTVPGAVSTHPRAIAAQDSGEVWVANGTGVSKISRAGTILGHFDLGATTGGLVVNQTRNEIWVSLPKSSVVKRLAADGQVLSTSAVGQLGDTLSDLELDSAGNLWTSGYTSGLLTKVSPDGKGLGATAVPRSILAIAVNQFDHVWALSGSQPTHDAGVLTKVGPDGQKLASFHDDGFYFGDLLINNQAFNIDIDPRGNLWVAFKGGSSPMEFTGFYVFESTL